MFVIISPKKRKKGKQVAAWDLGLSNGILLINIALKMERIFKDSKASLGTEYVLI